MDRVFGLINIDDFLFNEKYHHAKNDQFYWSHPIYFLWNYVENLVANNHYQLIYFRGEFGLFNQAFYY